MDALQYSGVAKRFGDVQAVKPLDLSIPEGGIFGLLGPNGAGKTTLIRMTLNILVPDQGLVSVFGEARSATPDSHFGYLPEDRGLYPKMKVGDLLRFFGRSKGLSSREADARVKVGLGELNLSEWEDKKVDNLSKGMQQKIQLLTALQHRPKIAVLDEPFSGLDPVNTEVFIQYIRRAMEQGTTVILSTHQMSQVEQLCDRIALINKGEVVLKGHVKEIRKNYATRDAVVSFTGDLPEQGEWRNLVAASNREDGGVRFTLKEGAPPSRFLAALVESGVEVTGFEEAQASMHEIFIRVVTGKEGGGDAVA
jgi:ABC-2 type transport system ATP-binding protein